MHAAEGSCWLAPAICKIGKSASPSGYRRCLVTIDLARDLVSVIIVMCVFVCVCVRGGSFNRDRLNSEPTGRYTQDDSRFNTFRAFSWSTGWVVHPVVQRISCQSFCYWCPSSCSSSSPSKVDRVFGGSCGPFGTQLIFIRVVSNVLTILDFKWVFPMSLWSDPSTWSRTR